MANQTRDGNGSSSNWTNPSNVNSDNGVDATLTCENLFDGSPKNCYDSGGIISTIDNFTITGQIGWVRGYAKVRRIDSAGDGGTMTRLYMYFNDGGGYCSGHNVGTVGTSYVTRSAICTHHAWTSSTIQNMQIKIQADLRADGNSTVRAGVDYIYSNVSNPIAPSAPADPSIVADGVGDLTVSSNTPSSGGDTITNVEHQISTSPTFASGNSTWTKGSAPTNPQTHQFTGEGNGQLHYARARYYNNYAGWGAYNASPYNSATTWDVPSTSADPTLVNFSNGVIRATKPTSPADNGSAITHWQVHWGVDSGVPVETGTSGDVVIGTSVYNASGLGNCNTFFFEVRFKNAVGYSAWSVGSVNETTWCLPTAPADPTITATAVKQMSTSQITPFTDRPPTDVEVQISTSATFSSGNITWTKGSAPTSPQLHDFTSGDGVTDDTLYYARARYKSSVGWGDYNASPYNSETSWAVPDAQDLVSATTPEGSMIRITRNGSYPNGNGDGVDSWEVWRSSTEGGSYSLIQDGLTATTYDDWTVNEGETWYYKAKFTNLVGDSALSTNAVNTTVTGIQLSLPSSLTVILRQQTSLPTNLRVSVFYQIFTPSSLKVRVSGLQTSLSSNLRVNATQQTSLSSTLRVLVFTASFTPEAIFSRYEKNDGAEPTIDNEYDMGLWEGYKTMNAIAVDPYENSMVNPDKHEFYYTVSPRSGTENFFQQPITNGFVSIDPATSGSIYETGYRGVGFEQQSWGVGVTEIIVEFDVDGDWAGSGSRVTLTGAWANTGTVWSPPSASGSNVLDVPHTYNGSVVVAVQPSDWDGNFDHKLHDWQPLQVNAGHAVEVKDFSMISGTHEDSEINLQGNLNTAYDMSFRVYHEHPKEWEWYSGATKIDSGTLTPNKDTWQFLDNLNLGTTHLSGTTVFELHLYCRSGTMLHPDDPVRVMTVNKII